MAIRVFIVDQTIRDHIVYSQLLVPLKLLNCREHLLLLPSNLLKDIENEQNHFRIVRYKNTFSKYLILLCLNGVEEMYTRSVFEFLRLYLLRLLFFRKWRIIYDFRGLAFAEAAMRQKSKLKVSVLEKLERFASCKADSLRTVSQKFADFLQQEWKVEKLIRIVPCCMATICRVEKSQSATPISFVYVGSVAPWQRLDDVLKFYKEWSKTMSTRLTIITPDISLVQKRLELEKIEGSVFSLPTQDVAEELKKHDFGFLLRDEILVNQVASPIKFLEYIGNGVIPIISQGVGDYTDICRETGIGVIESADLEQMRQQICQLKKDDRRGIKLYEIASQYTWEHYLQQF